MIYRITPFPKHANIYSIQYRKTYGSYIDSTQVTQRPVRGPDSARDACLAALDVQQKNDKNDRGLQHTGYLETTGTV